MAPETNTICKIPFNAGDSIGFNKTRFLCHLTAVRL